MSRRTEYSIRIQQSQIDILDHLNNSAYLEIFEEARVDFFTKGGYGPDVVKECKQSPILLEVTLRFMKEVRADQMVTIETEITEYKGKLTRMQQLMRDEAGQVCCRCTCVIGLFDLQERKLIKPTDIYERACVETEKA